MTKQKSGMTDPYPASKLEVVPGLAVVILTCNEDMHIGRAIGSVKTIADRVFVVDSGSVDRTVATANSAGATVLSHSWQGHARQFNWALDQLPPDTRWVLRLDADEIVTPKLAAQISRDLPVLASNVDGIFVGRCMHFLRRPMRYGGLFPKPVLRLFRFRRGRCEDRLMDEHIVVEGQTVTFDGEIIDDNLKPLGWWIEKHNHYAALEAAELLRRPNVLNETGPAGGGLSRYCKDHFYRRLPLGVRAFAYFFYRYVLRLGFLDGWEGAAFHILQGFWYRYLVDLKLWETGRFMTATGADVSSAARHVLDVDLSAFDQAEHSASMATSTALGGDEKRTVSTNPSSETVTLRPLPQRWRMPLEKTARTRQPAGSSKAVRAPSPTNQNV